MSEPDDKAAVAKHSCPRRMNEWGPWERTEGLDEYRDGHGIIAGPRACTFCGSMSPEDFLERVKAGAEVGPTDKNYKLYLSWPRPDADTLFVLGSTNASEKPHGDGWRSWDDLTPDQLEIARRDGYGRDDTSLRRTFVLFGTRPTVDAKFYTPHLSPEQGREFVALWQAGKVRWGYPGHPYRRLYVPGFEEQAAQPVGEVGSTQA